MRSVRFMKIIGVSQIFGVFQIFWGSLDFSEEQKEFYCVVCLLSCRVESTQLWTRAFILPIERLFSLDTLESIPCFLLEGLTGGRSAWLRNDEMIIKIHECKKIDFENKFLLRYSEG